MYTYILDISRSLFYIKTYNTYCKTFRAQKKNDKDGTL